MAIDLDDLSPLKPRPQALDLGRLSIEELTHRIAALEAEIARCRAMIAAKEQDRSAAEAVFKSR